MALWPTSVWRSTLPNMSSRKNVTERETDRKKQLCLISWGNPYIHAAAANT